jgi:hypothetical protein
MKCSRLLMFACGTILPTSLLRRWGSNCRFALYVGALKQSIYLLVSLETLSLFNVLFALLKS